MKVMLFTSSFSEEGKTMVSTNIAIAMAQAGNRVLLVDGDLRKPAIARIFGINRVPGLTDVILGNYEWKDVRRTITDIMMGEINVDDSIATPGMDNLHIITGGSNVPNPAELVSSKSILEFIKQVRAEYDMVLIDTAPVLAATDAAVWGSRCDGVIMVYQVGKIARGALKRAKAQLDAVQARIAGVVLNGLKAEISPDFGYPYKYFYYYGDTPDHKAVQSKKDRITSWFNNQFVKRYPIRRNKSGK
jgi:capsular exopolysaccharide synthesis family protein